MTVSGHLAVANEMLAKHGLAESIQLEEGEGARFKTGTFSGVRTLAGYTDTSKHGCVRFVIALTSNDGAMRFRLLKAIQSGL